MRSGAKSLAFAVRRLTFPVLCSVAARAAEKPNILFIAVDDLRPELGCYGAAHVKSPNIDKLAAGGLRFERAYCQQAVCNPSRCSVLSGCRPDTTRVIDNNTALRKAMPGILTLPQHFMNGGYHAASFGKIFHHSATQPGEDPASWSEPAWHGPEKTRHWFTPESEALVAQRKKTEGGKKPSHLLRGPPFEAADLPDAEYGDAKLADQAVAALQRLKDRPFFLAVGFWKPHLPFTCPKKYWDLYPAEKVRLAANRFPPKAVPDVAMNTWSELRTYGGVPPEGPISAEMELNLTRGYLACVSFVDAQIGRVLDELERLGLDKNTVVILWGDHGWHLGENGIWGKQTNFERAAHAPLVLRTPERRAAGRATPALVEFVDIYPTLCELAGLPLPTHLEGRSFAPLLDDPARPWKTAAFSQYPRGKKNEFMGCSVRTDRHRFTRWVRASSPAEIVGLELYDHQADPEENVNLAGDEASAALVRDLGARLDAGWRTALPPP